MKIRTLALLCIASCLPAQEVLPRKAETFDVGGKPALLYRAPKPARSMPWLWYAPTIKGISLVGRKVYFERFMKAGISIAGYDFGEVRGSPASTEKFSEFYAAMVKRGFSSKPILLGQSRGGMMTLAWAFRNPDKVRAWVGIYPVCNLASWSLQRSEALTLQDFGLARDELVQRLSEFNPIDNLAGLAAQKVPMFIVHGDSDLSVPYHENSKILQERYEAACGTIHVKVIPGEGHKAGPSFFECAELVEFVLRQAL
jgi:pimeloyl-ACP methyl ester carboxylesterase